MVWIIVILLVMIFQMATILLLEYRQPAKAVAWLSILLVFPLVGFVMYYFLAKEYHHRRKAKLKGAKISEEIRTDILRRSQIVHRLKDLNNPALQKEPRLYGLLQNLPESPITSCNETTVLTDGYNTFQAILTAIESARHHIHMEYYILRDDQIGRRFRDVLIQKAAEGVQVRMIYDGVGSYELTDSYLQPLYQAGIQAYSFLLPRIAFFDKRLNYRNHRKIVVVDGLIGFLGGINIGDEYLGKHVRLGYWRDTHLQVQGDAVYNLQQTFLGDWAFVSQEKLMDRSYYPSHDCQGVEQVQMIPSGPDTNWDTLLELFFGALSVASQRIYVTSPYFIPDNSIFIALKTAAISGVDVRVILPGVSDSKIVKSASLSYIKELMQVGVRFYEYQKGFVHAKTLVVDQLLASIGTANMDMRSLYSNFELNAVMFNPTTIERVHADFMRDLQDSKEITLAAFMRRPRRQKMMEVLARLLSPLL